MLRASDGRSCGRRSHERGLHECMPLNLSEAGHVGLRPRSWAASPWSLNSAFWRYARAQFSSSKPRLPWTKLIEPSSDGCAEPEELGPLLICRGAHV